MGQLKHWCHLHLWLDPGFRRKHWLEIKRTAEYNFLVLCQACARITQHPLISELLFTPLAPLLEMAKTGSFDEVKHLQLLKVVCSGIWRKGVVSLTNPFFARVLIQDRWSESFPAGWTDAHCPALMLALPWTPASLDQLYPTCMYQLNSDPKRSTFDLCV